LDLGARQIRAVELAAWRARVRPKRIRGREGDDTWVPHVSVCGGGELSELLGFGEWEMRSLLE